jgi:hypothetical protein
MKVITSKQNNLTEVLTAFDRNFDVTTRGSCIRMKLSLHIEGILE